jgi:RsiW-degrading membrane proteinase PrsW (M82 family)
LFHSALGFATAENVEYVFGVAATAGGGKNNPVNLFVGELIVLGMRILLPIHFICAILQAANLSQVVMGTSQMNLISVRVDLVSLL